MSHNAILAVISLLAEKWPSCFSIIESGRRPLKLGIRDDVLAALDGAISAGKVLQRQKAEAAIRKIYSWQPQRSAMADVSMQMPIK